MVDRRSRHDELGVPAAQAHLDRAWHQIERDLCCGSRDHIEQHQAGSRFERSDEPTGEDPGVIIAGLCGQLELALQLLDVQSQFYDVTVTPCQGTMMSL